MLLIIAVKASPFSELKSDDILSALTSIGASRGRPLSLL